MQTYKHRQLEKNIEKSLTASPAVALLGPRQCGKSTLAKYILSLYAGAIYLDLERPSDYNQLNDVEAFFSVNTGKLVCLDEIQRKPDLFPVLRSILDDSKDNGQLLLLGSASRDLIQQSSETLAGRIFYWELTPFLLSELKDMPLRTLWFRGGFPRSLFAQDEESSFLWRQNFIHTFLERDIPQLGFKLQTKLLERFWSICAHWHGQLVNFSRLGESLGVSYHTIQSYLDLLEQTYMIRVLRPLNSNLNKRMTKSPRMYLRDTGILHALLNIETINALLGHPVYGSSWEGFVIETILHTIPHAYASFYRTASGSEIDLILDLKNGRRIAVECKVSTAPAVTKGFYTALNDLELEEAWIIAPVNQSYWLNKGVKVISLEEFLKLNFY